MTETLSKYQLIINPVENPEAVVLPNTIPMPVLADDLLIRIKGFWGAAHRLGFSEEAVEFLSYLGDGYRRPFDITRFEPAINDEYYHVKTKLLDALQELSEQFRGRISTIVWDTFAFLGTRPNPDQYSTILAQKEYLPFPWYIADTVLHAVGKVYGLKHHIDAVVFKHSRMIFEHNCDCGCSFYDPPEGNEVGILLDQSRFPLATAALLSHLCSESLLLMGLKLPFEIGVSPEAAEVMVAIPSASF